MKVFSAVSSIILALAAVSAIAGTLPGGNLKITEKMLRFRYIPIEGDGQTTCTHTLLDPDSQDWAVRCGAKTEFRVHLWVTAYTHASAPLLSYETLFWVTQTAGIRAGSPSVTGTTIWTHLKDPSALSSLELSQQIENGGADLSLEIKVLD